MIIDVSDLVFRYASAPEPTVKGMSFSVEKGEIFGFLGPSGAGKSTTQKVLTKVNRGFEGTVKVFGDDLVSLGQSYYERIGVGFELPNHYERLTARENLQFIASVYSGETRNIDELLESVDLLPDGDKRVENFSKGMKMRLNFVRALMHRPEILFLDEPTSGLDPVNAQRMKDLIREEQKRGTTVFLTTHNMHDADELCDRVAFVVNGTIEELDTPENLKRAHGKKMVTVEYMAKKALKTKEFGMDGLGKNDEFLQVLKEGEIRTIHSQEASLDQVFIKTTGVELDG